MGDIETHLAPKPLIIAEHICFHKCNKKAGKSVADFCVAMLEFCEVGTTLNNAIRERMVCGFANEQIHRKLLVQANLMYDLAKAITTTTRL